MRWWSVVLALALVMAAVPVGAADQPDIMGARECFAALQAGLSRGGDHVELAAGCGTLERTVTTIATQTHSYTCESETHYVLGLKVWEAGVCESWDWDGKSITRHLDPPTIYCNTKASYECSVNGYGWSWVSQPWSGRAWLSTQIKQEVAGVIIGSVTLNFNLYLYGDGHVVAA